MSKKVAVVGDLYCCLETRDLPRLETATNYSLTLAGNGAGIAVALARFDHPSFLVSRVPVTELGQKALLGLKDAGVATEYVLSGEGRMALLFREEVRGWREARELWDADYSALSQLRPHDILWARVLKGMGWFHWSAMLTAFGDMPAATVLAALQTARSLRIPVSCDLAWSQGLWPEKLARDVLTPLLSYTDYVVTTPAALRVFCPGRQRDQLKILTGRHGLKMAALYQEDGPGDRGSLSGLLWDSTAFYTSRPLDVPRERGGLQAFTAAMISSILAKEGPRQALDLGLAAATLKMSEPGELNHVTILEARDFRKSFADVRLRREEECL